MNRKIKSLLQTHTHFIFIFKYLFILYFIPFFAHITHCSRALTNCPVIEMQFSCGIHRRFMTTFHSNPLMNAHFYDIFPTCMQ